jgi:hypothetical protein
MERSEFLIERDRDMRLTRETLIRVARETANQRVRVSRRLICIYLTGSVLGESPLLGGTTDIDLVMIHDSEPLQARETVRLTDEIHLDISHYPQSMFHHPRHLRTHPWLGPFIYSKPMVLHDTQHWFDFAQAATGAQFHQPEYTLKRAGTLAQAARQGWMDLMFSPEDHHARRVYAYLRAMENAGNALASLSGEPIAERRFFLLLPQRLQSLQDAEITGELVHLLTPNPAQLEPAWARWLPAWKETYLAAGQQENIPARISPGRVNYYERALPALWQESPTAAVWLLMRTWTLAASHAPADSAGIQAWRSACELLELGEENFSRRLDALDHFLDRMEETLETWGQSNGVSISVDL